MSAPAVFKPTVPAAPGLVRGWLESAGLSIDEDVMDDVVAFARAKLLRGDEPRKVLDELGRMSGDDLPKFLAPHRVLRLMLAHGFAATWVTPFEADVHRALAEAPLADALKAQMLERARAGKTDEEIIAGILPVAAIAREGALRTMDMALTEHDDYVDAPPFLRDAMAPAEFLADELKKQGLPDLETIKKERALLAQLLTPAKPAPAAEIDRLLEVACACGEGAPGASCPHKKALASSHCLSSRIGYKPGLIDRALLLLGGRVVVQTTRAFGVVANVGPEERGIAIGFDLPEGTPPVLVELAKLVVGPLLRARGVTHTIVPSAFPIPPMAKVTS